MSSRARLSFRACLSSRAQRGICISAVIILLLAPAAVEAQRADSSCTYSTCSLNIVPRLSALDIVRGNGENRVGSLAFLFPHHVASPFASSPAATQHANAAFSRRRVAAILTNAGIVMAAAAATRAIPTARRGTLATIGFAFIGSSVPIHFAADAELSRAVWEYNRQFAR